MTESENIYKKNVMVTGYSKLPESALLHSRYSGNFSVILELERKTGKIIHLDCATNSEIQLSFLNRLLTGETIQTEDGMQRIVKLLDRNFSCALRKPVYSGIVACRKKFEELVAKYPG
jgi:hypothetical protein